MSVYTVSVGKDKIPEGAGRAEVVAGVVPHVGKVLALVRIRAASDIPLTVGAIVSTRARGKTVGDEDRGDLGDRNRLDDEEGRRLLLLGI